MEVSLTPEQRAELRELNHLDATEAAKSSNRRSSKRPGDQCDITPMRPPLIELSNCAAGTFSNTSDC